MHRPLKVTPALGLAGYVFPVAGTHVRWGDGYGAPRNDIADGWHHGDDLFAPLGTPVLAAADGTLSQVGWEGLGGWRLWLTDAAGNQFYYAHLAAYAPAALHSTRVRAGEVIGFLGRTGDAFTTTPHLHFEIHPRQLLSLQYDGAVDPSGYLAAWTHQTPRRVPLPTKPAAPIGQPRYEAAVVWRQLLAARGLTPPRRTSPAAHVLTRPLLPRLRREVRRLAAAPATGHSGRTGLTATAALLLLLACAAVGGVAGICCGLRLGPRTLARALPHPGDPTRSTFARVRPRTPPPQTTPDPEPILPPAIAEE